MSIHNDQQGLNSDKATVPRDKYSKNFQEQIIGYQAKSPLGAPIAIIIIASMNAYFAHDSISSIYWAPWLALVVFVTLFRIWFLGKVHASQTLSLQAKLNRCMVSATLNGVVHASALLFFPVLTFGERSLLSLVLLGLISGSIVTTLGHRRIFVPYSATIIVAMALSWALTKSPQTGLVAQFGVTILIVMFYGTQLSISRRYLDAVQETFAAREEHVDLNERLNNELKSSLNKEEQLTELNQKLNVALNEAVSASESKTRFLALASHDLRQPIHTLSLFSAALSLRPLDEKSATIASRMETAVGNLASQMDSLLDISKLDAGMVDPDIVNIDLVAFLERMALEHHSIAQAENLEFAFLNSVDTAATTTDPELFERVIRNLLGNAIKYTDAGSVNMSLGQEKDDWRITISDTGRGISETDKAKIFEEFYQVDNPERNRMKGLGLGLAIVKRLTTLLSINLEFSSSLDVGTSFELSLPKVEAHDFHKDSESHIPSIAGLNIICVDDEIAIREAIEDLLGAMDCNVFTCRGTAEAVALAKQMKPDALLADFRLIGEDSGLKTIDSVREIHPNLPAILVSGDTSPKRLKQARDANIPMLHKPVSAEKLQLIIAEIVNT